jgi:general secretion pathway protein G
MLSNRRGLSLIELIVAMVILSILASLVVPMAQMTSKRVKEIELRRSLRIIRTALDDYNRNYELGVAAGKITRSQNENGYPKTLQVLVEGYDFGGAYSFKKKFLRKIPQDPFAPPDAQEPKWSLRGYKDDPDSKSGVTPDDVYDVYSLSKETAIDGTKYEDW